MFSWGPRGEQKLWIYVVCDWMRARTPRTDVEHGERGKGASEFRGEEQQLVFDQRETLDGKRPRGAAGPAQLPHVLTLLNESWHHNYIIIVQLHLFIQLCATKWTEWACLNPGEGTSSRWAALINWFADPSGRYLFRIGYRPTWWMRCSLFDDSV